MELDQLLEIASEMSGCTKEELTSETRKMPVPIYRQLIWYFMQKDLGYSDSRIASLFGKNRATVAYGIDKVESAFRPPIIKDVINTYSQFKHHYYERH